MTKKYQELEAKIAELQAEVERLKKEEKDNQLPEDFHRYHALLFLNENKDSQERVDHINLAFRWITTPQGGEYWRNISDNLEGCSTYSVPQEAIIQIQKWVIQSYQQEFES